MTATSLYNYGLNPYYVRQHVGPTFHNAHLVILGLRVLQRTLVTTLTFSK